jgi:metal-responsive CopG/Arc/MetJ family transcriptional regulator
MNYMVNDMTALSLRLPDDIDARLDQEAQAEGKSRSEIARLAIAEFLARREKERFMAEMVEEMRRAYADPEIRREALEIAEDTVDDGLDAIIAEERAAGIDPGEKWWR